MIEGCGSISNEKQNYNKFIAEINGILENRDMRALDVRYNIYIYIYVGYTDCRVAEIY